jgi:hypothetical protein
MSGTLGYFVVLGVLFGGLGSIGIWSPRSLPVKLGAALVVACSLAAAYAALVDLLGRPKPLALAGSERSAIAQARVIAAQLVEDEVIYLWLQVDGAEEPRAYALPWTESAARELHEMRRRSEAEGTELRVREVSDGGDAEGGMRFHALPRRALPPKHAS